MEGLVWQPFALQAGEYYKYEVFDYTENKTGWVSISVAAKDGKLEASGKGSVKTEESSPRQSQMSLRC